MPRGYHSCAPQSIPREGSALAQIASDYDLVAALRVRDEEAFAVLVEAYAPLIGRWTSRMVRDPGEAEDVVQDVLLAAWWYAPSLRADSVLLPWLRTITDNACRKRARTRARRPAVPAGLSPQGGRATEPRDVAQRVDVEAALGQLPPREAGILRLLYADDVPLDEAARQMHVSSEAARSLAARARRRFRSKFTGWFRAMAGVGLPADFLVTGAAPPAARTSAGAVAAAAALVLAGAGTPAPETTRARVARVEAAETAVVRPVRPVGDGGPARFALVRAAPLVEREDLGAQLAPPPIPPEETIRRAAPVAGWARGRWARDGWARDGWREPAKERGPAVRPRQGGSTGGGDTSARDWQERGGGRSRDPGNRPPEGRGSKVGPKGDHGGRSGAGGGEAVGRGGPGAGNSGGGGEAGNPGGGHGGGGGGRGGGGGNGGGGDGRGGGR